MSRPLRYVEVLMSGKGSPCHEESYVIVFDGDANEKIMKGDDQWMFAEMMHGFHRTHQPDYKAMVKGVRKKGVLKWVAGDKGNVIFDMLCVEETDVELGFAPRLLTAHSKFDHNAPRLLTAHGKFDHNAPQLLTAHGKIDHNAPEKLVALAAMKEPAELGFAPQLVALATMKEPAVVAANPGNTRQSLVCKNQPCYLRPAIPGMARQLGDAKTRAFVNGGRLPGQGSCGNYCVSRLSSTSLSAIDIAKSRALAQFL